jgi:hypothetical protein
MLPEMRMGFAVLRFRTAADTIGENRLESIEIGTVPVRAGLGASAVEARIAAGDVPDR